MLSALDMPAVQVVPWAMAMEADHVPEAHRMKEVPPAEQYHVPSGVQAAPATGEPLLVPLATGTAAEADAAEGAAPPEPDPADEAAGIGETTAVDVAARAEADAPPAPEAKTPPPLADGAAAEAEPAEPAAADVAAGEAPEAELPDEEPPDDVLLPPDEVEVSPPVHPVGGPKLTPMLPFWTLDPGFGY